MHCYYIIWTLSLMAAGFEVTGQNEFHSDDKVLSRKKRYVVFPEGSTFSVAWCMTVKALTGNDNIFTEGVNWAISYDLPNETVYDDYKGALLPAPAILRRSRRDLYRKVETALDSAGFDGRQCILKTICETAQRLLPRRSLFEEMFRIIFTLPIEAVAAHEPIEHAVYDAAHRNGLNNQNCNDLFPECSISILDIALFGAQWNYG